MIIIEDELKAAKQEIDNLQEAADQHKGVIKEWRRMVAVRDEIITRQQAIIETVKQAVEDA